jgi:hypothetical protein
VRETDFIVLFPLMTDEQVASCVSAVSQRLDLGQPEPRRFSLRQVQDLAPLALSWDNSAITSSRA